MPGSKKQNVPARRRKRGAGRRVSQVIRADESGVEPATALKPAYTRGVFQSG